eukprot:g15664.t1
MSHEQGTELQIQQGISKQPLFSSAVALGKKKASESTPPPATQDHINGFPAQGGSSYQSQEAHGEHDNTAHGEHQHNRQHGKQQAQHVEHRRLLDRDGVFYQSMGRYQVQRRGRMWVRNQFYLEAFTFTLLNGAGWRILLVVFVCYYSMWSLWALFYWALAEPCHLDIVTFTEALFFSMETSLTIGYSTSGDSIYYNSCLWVFNAIATEVIFSVFLNAIVFGLLFLRMARPTRRAITVIFTDKAVVRKVNGQYFFMCQVVEMRKHQLVEAHVRMYAVRKMQDDTGHLTLQPRVMRLNRPDDQMGAFIFTMLPTTVVHQIDCWSPLYPFVPRAESGDADAIDTYLFQYPSQRSADSVAGSRPGIVCQVCGASFASLLHYRRHMIYQRESDQAAGLNAKTICSVCGEALVSAWALQQHAAHSHPNEKVEPRVARHARRTRVCHLPLQHHHPTDEFPSASLSLSGDEHDFDHSDEELQHKTSSARARHEHKNNPKPLQQRAQEPEPEEEAGAVWIHTQQPEQAQPHKTRQTSVRWVNGGEQDRDRKRKEGPRRRKRKGRPAGPERETELTTELLSAFWQRIGLEVVVVVEGLDSITSGTVQARHSYSFCHSDIVFNHNFVNPTLYTERCTVLDFDRFHLLRPDNSTGELELFHGHESLTSAAVRESGFQSLLQAAPPAK